MKNLFWKFIDIKSFLMMGTALILAGSLEFAKPSMAAAEEHGHAHGHTEEEGEDHNEKEGSLKLTAEQISASGVATKTIQSGNISNEVSVPGKVIADANRMAEIVPKVSGIVIEALRNLGDTVEKGDVMARIESRELAEVVAEYQAASRSAELARTTYNREKTLWEKKVTAEQDYLTAKNVWQESQIQLDLTKKKMDLLGYDSSEKKSFSRYYEMTSPLSGRVVARELTMGQFVDATHTAYAVADLSVLWVDTAIAPDDLSFVKEGQTAVIKTANREVSGKLIFVSPVINPDTRSAKAIIEIGNEDGSWRPGDYVTALIATSQDAAKALAPKNAVQTIEGKSFVFIRTQDGFERREVTLGRSDSINIEITSGAEAGEEIAASNTFILKAEAGKSEAEHSH